MKVTVTIPTYNKADNLASMVESLRALDLPEVGMEGFDLGSVHSQGYAFQAEMAYVCQRLGHHVLEVPVCLGDRRTGESKMMVKVKLEAALRVWEVLWRRRCLLSPLPEA